MTDRIPYAFEFVTGPASEPVSLAEAKLQCRELGTDEDTNISGLISTARELVELNSERLLISQTWNLWMDAFPTYALGQQSPVPQSPQQYPYYGPFLQTIGIDRKPVTAINFVKYTDTAGNVQTIDPSLYRIDLASAPARIQPVFGKLWPIPMVCSNAVQIQFVAGAADATGVPNLAKHAIKLLVGHWFENREAVGQVPANAELALGYWNLIAGLRWR